MTFDFATWLHSNDRLKDLLLCADYVIKKAGRSSIQLDHLFQEEISDGLGSLTQIVAGHLWCFLKKKSETIASQASEYLSRGDVVGFMAIVADRFLDDCLDERRTMAVNPSYAYYRHLRQVLSKAEGVNYQPTRQGSFYALSFSPGLQQLPKEHWNHPYGDWPSPQVPTSEIHKNSGILRLSHCYWDEALERFMAEYFLPVKELGRYIDWNYSLGCLIVGESQLTQADEEEGCRPFSFDDMTVTHECNDELGCIARQNPRLECDVIESELETLAQDCLMELTDRQRTILVRVDEGATLEEVARELGEKGASNVHYHLKKAYLVMRRKWSLWGPPSLPQFSEVDEEEFFIFYEKVIEFCKNGKDCRTS